MQIFIWKIQKKFVNLQYLVNNQKIKIMFNNLKN